MTNSIQQINKTSAGLCPHGLPPSACPICSKNSGGGGRLHAGERLQKAGEMSYYECMIMGIQIRQRAENLKKQLQNIKLQKEFLEKYNQKIENLINKLVNFVNSVPQNFILKPVIYTINNIAIPILNIIKSLPVFIENFKNFFNKIEVKLIDIQDKLVAILADIELFIKEKINKFLKISKKKLKNIFRIFHRNFTDNNDTEKDEDKKIFNLKIIMKKIFNRDKKNKNDTKN